MRKPDSPPDVELGSFAYAPHHAAEVAKAVDGDHGGFFERRAEESARQMRPVMLDKMEFCSFVNQSSRFQLGSHAGDANIVSRSGHQPGPILRTRCSASQLTKQVRTRVA